MILTLPVTALCDYAATGLLAFVVVEEEERKAICSAA